MLRKLTMLAAAVTAILSLTPAANAQQKWQPSKAEIERLRAQAIAEMDAIVAEENSLVNKVRPGLGNDEGEPEMRPLALGGVQIDGPIKGEDFDEGECKGKRLTVGKDGAVKACIAFCGTGEVELPPGLMLLSDWKEGQHGLLIEQVNFFVPPTSCTGGPYQDKEEKDEEELRRNYFIIEVNLRCLNAGRSPSFKWTPYTMGGVTTDPDLLELLAILAPKKLEADKDIALVQEAIYEITEKKGLRKSLKERLSQLPNRT